MKKNKPLFLIVSILVLFNSCVSTEVDVTSYLSGTVKEAATLNPLSGCVVTITPGNNSIATDSNGCFDFGALDIGEYTLTFNLANYRTTEYKVILKLSKHENVDAVLNKAERPTVVIGEALDISAKRFKLQGNIIDNGGQNVIERGFYVGEDVNSMKKYISTDESSIFYCLISDLKQETAYSVKAYAINSIGESSSEVISVTTTQSELPDVSTLNAEDVAINTAKLLGQVPSTEGISECGFYIGTTEEPTTKIVSSVESVFSSVATGLVPNTKYFYLAYASDDKREKRGEVKSFTTNALMHNNHEYVDFGLPSEVKWATMNVGSSHSYGFGNRFSWGETSTKTSYTQNNYKYFTVSSSGAINYSVEYCTIYSDSAPCTLIFQDDAARQNWQGNWRTPTKEEFEELLLCCQWKIATKGGQLGYLVIGTNGSELFLPITSYNYMTASCEGFSQYFLSLSEEGKNIMKSSYYYDGLYVRPVFK